MDKTELCFTPATELANAIRAKKLSSVEITSTVLERITALEPKLNAFAYLAAQEAMDAAAAADSALAKGESLGPLHGVPVDEPLLVIGAHHDIVGGEGGEPGQGE